MAVSNPEFLDLTLMDAFKRVVAGLGEAGLMVILDNQVSRPEWCCGLNDGNGFFGDLDFDPGAFCHGRCFQGHDSGRGNESAQRA